VHAAIGLHTSDKPDRNLPVITKHDRRFANGGEHEAVETEAFSQGVIVGIVRERLDALLKVIQTPWRRCGNVSSGDGN
jgi:hypothetical protein